MKVAVVVDDGSRPTPVAKILPAVLDELQSGGVRLDQVTVVPALGVHRPMTGEELGERIGVQWLTQLKWENPDCDDLTRLANLVSPTGARPSWSIRRWLKPPGRFDWLHRAAHHRQLRRRIQEPLPGCGRRATIATTMRSTASQTPLTTSGAD